MPTLSWLTRDEDLKAAGRAPYRLLQEVPELGHGDPDAGNMLIQGDNLEALKSLLPFYAGQVKCIYIDPPFNTGQMFTRYDDNLEHSVWLGVMQSRFGLLAELLHSTGSLFLHLDDNEIDYAKVVLDEIFGRRNFVSRITLKARSPSAFSTVNPGVFKSAEYLLWYAKDRSEMYQERIWVPRAPDTAYNKWLINHLSAPAEWKLEALGPVLLEELKNAGSVSALARAERSFYIENASRIVRLAEIDDEGAGQDIVETKKNSLSNPNKIYTHSRDGYDDIYVLGGQQLLFYEKNIKTIDGERTPARMLTNIWDDIAWEGIAREGGVRLPKAKKPERLLRRCLQLTTLPGDLVLDSFLGSGTTAAVAMKMGRRAIGIERGDQATQLCQPRLKNVVNADSSGISRLEGWKGGSGFRFYRLGDPVFDETGRLTASIAYSTLAAHVWFDETSTPLNAEIEGPLLGVHGARAVALLYNGVLGDKRPAGGNVLTRQTLAIIREGLPSGFEGDVIVYGERSALTPATLARERIAFRQTPYDVKTRR